MNELQKERNEVILKKHVNAIHCSNNLSLIQRKLFNALLYNAYPNLSQNNLFKVPVKDLCRLIGYNSNDHMRLKIALVGLITIVIEWNIIEEDNKQTKWKASSVLSSAELSNGWCTYEYSQMIKELFYRPEIYGKIDIDAVSKFKSSYGLALYENCIRYQNLTHTPSFPIETFKVLMGVFGDKYKVFKDFNKRVLSIAVKEVNNLSPICITPEIEKVNRQVTRIKFKISKNSLLKQNRVLSINECEIEKKLMEVFGFSHRSVISLVEEYKKDYIKEKIDLILESESFRNGGIKSLSGYLIESLRKDYRANRSSKEVINEEKERREKKDQEIAKIKKQTKDKYNQYLQSTTKKYYFSLTSEEQDKVLALFTAKIKSDVGPLYTWYKSYGFSHKGVQECFHHFIRESYQIHVLSYDDFCLIIES